MSSCLLPQYDEPLPAFPPVKNRPPRLDVSRATPPLTVLNNIGSMCASPKVEIAVDDDDVSDRIRIRWLVYESNGNLAMNQIMDPTSLQGGLIPRRPTITAPKNVFTNTLLGNTGTARRLQLIVADGEFTTREGLLATLPKNEQPYELPDGGTIDDETFMDTYTWVVDTVSSPCQ